MRLMHIHSASAGKRIMRTLREADQPVSGYSDKSRNANTESSAVSLFYHLRSLFNNSLTLYSEDDKERKTWKGRVKERKKE